MGSSWGSWGNTSGCSGVMKDWTGEKEQGEGEEEGKCCVAGGCDGGIIMLFFSTSIDSAILLVRDPIAFETICQILPLIACIWEMVAEN